MDWERIATLLEVIHNSAQAGPRFSYVTSAAIAELEAHFANPAPEHHEEEEDHEPQRRI